MEPTGGTDRPAPYWESEEAFRKAVAAATKEVFDQVERRRPLRMLIVAALIGVVVGSGISIPTTIVLNNAAHKASVTNSRENCKLITKLAKIDQVNYANSIKGTAEFEAKSKDRFGLSQHDFEEFIKRGEEEEHTRLVAIEAIAATNCSTAVK